MAWLEISFDLSRIDFEGTSALIRQSYWGGLRTDEIHRRAFENSVCAIALIDGRQVGFARASGDRAVFARISDVIVWPEHRGQGVGKALVQALLDHPELASVSTWMLNTSDAHSFYAHFGFKPATDGNEMRLDRPVLHDHQQVRG
ncbi:GNAT family N-acetyltransferase [Chelativorans salis]|uniref:GNAT family N-acetyltransferase n=1 Tax=Chelativorans salis TaxID=2978478 RepID=A0ABT2LLP4_9HYPH|nr:GNAT family N-acetyltransferase [Chelativorans sp. EGI FJ00035]MCT7375502.1 GNAT family N-acetyltransferase [Chelativorans sp. EGI FJ00035]